MEELGMVDSQVPEQSTVLSWIDRAKPQSSLITADVIAQEHDAFLEWIQHSARCGDQVCPTFDDPCGQNTRNASLCTPTAAVGTGFVDPGDRRELTLEQVFTANVYVWRERCAPCHFTSDMQVNAPKWISDATDERTAPELSCVAGSLETMGNVLERGLIDLAVPPSSLLLQKPLGIISHGGGPKFEGTEALAIKRSSPSSNATPAAPHWTRRYPSQRRRPLHRPPLPTRTTSRLIAIASRATVTTTPTPSGA